MYETEYARTIGDAMISSEKNEEKLLTELCKRFPEDISKRIISSIKEKPLIWNLLNPKAITY